MTFVVVSICKMVTAYTFRKTSISYCIASVDSFFAVTAYDASLPIFAVSFSNAEFKLQIPNFAFFAAFCDFSN